MAERDQPSFVIDTEVIISNSGSYDAFSNVTYADEQSRKAAFEVLEEVFGSPPIVLTSQQTEANRGTCYFSSLRWNANWQPEGPRPNWRTEDGTPIQ